MGFIDWFKNNASEETDSHLDLLGGSQPLPEKRRVDRTDVLKDFQAQIKESGGSQRAYPQAIAAETEELFGESIDSLYNGVGGKRGDRDTLPRSAQKAYMHNEIDCTQQLKRQGRQSGNQGEREARSWARLERPLGRTAAFGSGINEQ